ncbi:MAG: transposase InsO family protein [Colwellia sp.]
MLDLFSLKVIGWALSNSPDSKLIMQALMMTYQSRGQPKDIIFTQIKVDFTQVGSSDNGCGDTK